MMDGHFRKMMMKFVHNQVDVGCDVCTLLNLVCALSSNGGGYNFIADLIINDHININTVIDEHDVEIKHQNKLSGSTNNF